MEVWDMVGVVGWGLGSWDGVWRCGMGFGGMGWG